MDLPFSSPERGTFPAFAYRPVLDFPHVSFGPFPAATFVDRPSLQHPARQRSRLPWATPERLPGLFTRGQ